MSDVHLVWQEALDRHQEASFHLQCQTSSVAFEHATSHRQLRETKKFIQFTHFVSFCLCCPLSVLGPCNVLWSVGFISDFVHTVAVTLKYVAIHLLLLLLLHYNYHSKYQ